MNNSIKRRKLI